MNICVFVVFVLVVLDTYSYCQTTSGCLLPRGPSPHVYCDLGCDRCAEAGATCRLSAGSLFVGGIVKVMCESDYRLSSGRDYDWVQCNRSRWVEEFPDCRRPCPALVFESLVPHCVYNGGEVDCKSPVLPSTTATADCKPTYAPYPGMEGQGVYGPDGTKMRCLHNGKWSGSIPECRPDCGRSKGSAISEATVAQGGIPTPLGVFPWHAGLYQQDGRDWSYQCGGSLIGKQVVMTAAHCIPTTTLDKMRVTFAKHYIDWDRDEKDTVKRNVTDVSIPTEFSHAVTTLLWDIALLFLSDPVDFNSFVMPVCLTDALPPLDPSHPITGYVVGWGPTEQNGENSDILLHNNISLEWENRCKRLEVAKLVIFDKFCAMKNSASIVHRGDSGGGLTTVYNRQHYLLGVVSVKYNNVSVFTNVTWDRHVYWRKREINRFEENLARCPRWGFACASTGRCVAGSARCDGYRHCPDGSDEIGCPKNSTPTPTRTEVPTPTGTEVPPPSELPDEPAEPLPRLPTEPTKPTEKFFIVSKERASWRGAERACVSNNTHLATVEDEYENEELRRSLRSSVVSLAWIGANDQRSEGNFTWAADGTPVGFAAWGFGEPSNHWGGKHCVRTSDGTWYTEDCTRETYFVCQAYRPF